MIGAAVNLLALVDTRLDIGIEGGAELLAFSNAIVGTDPGALEAARTALAGRLGPAAVSAAAIIAANFSKNDRIANAIGIPMDPPFLAGTADLREQLGINRFRSARNTLKD